MGEKKEDVVRKAKEKGEQVAEKAEEVVSDVVSAASDTARKKVEELQHEEWSGPEQDMQAGQQPRPPEAGREKLEPGEFGATEVDDEGNPT